MHILDINEYFQVLNQKLCISLPPIVTRESAHFHLCLLIYYLSSYRKNQNQNFTEFVSLDLTHVLGHSVISSCLMY